MNRKTLTAICALWLLALNPSFACPAHGQAKATPAPVKNVAQDDNATEKLVNDEAFGPVRLGLTDGQLQKAVGAPASKTPVALEPATGQHVSDWKYPKLGLTLKMAADKKAGPFTVASFALESPSRFRSTRGVGIGSSADQIRKAYKGFVEPGSSDRIVVGSEYMGIIFTLEGGKATYIFVGAAAE